MFFFILQTLFLALLASLIGYFIGRFLKKLFCKNNTSTNSKNTLCTATSSTTPSKTEGVATSKLNKTPVIASAGAGAAAVAQALSDREAVSYSSSETVDDTEINIDDEVSEELDTDTLSTAETVEPEQTIASIEETEDRAIEVTSTNITEAISSTERLDTTHDEVEVTADDDNSLVNISKIAAATIATGVAAQVGATTLDDNEDDITEIVEDTEVSTDELESEIIEVAEIEAENIEIPVYESDVENIDSVDDSINEYIEDELEAITDNEDDDSLLDVAKTAAVAVTTGVTATAGATLLDSEEDNIAKTLEDTEISIPENETTEEIKNIETSINELESEVIKATEVIDIEDAENSSSELIDDTLNTTIIDSEEDIIEVVEEIEASTNELEEKTQQAEIPEDQESSNIASDEGVGLLNTLKTAATVAGSGVIAKASATVLADDDSDNNSQDEDVNSSSKGVAIEEIEGIGKGYGKRLRSMDIHTTIDLFNKCTDTDYEKKIAQKMTVNESAVNSWYQMADLMRIEGVDGQVAELLFFSGITSAQELSIQNENKLFDKIERTNEAQHRTKETPAKEMIPHWITSAKLLCKE